MVESVVRREMAMIGKVLAVSIPPGTPIHDAITGKLLGVVQDRQPVINGDTCYLSTADYKAAKEALPSPDQIKH